MGNAFDSNSYNTYYKMANSLRCLAYGKESDISCGVKEGVAFNGSASIYSYGHGTLIEGPDGKQLFHVLTVMIDSLKSFRGLWVAEQQFNSDGTPKYSTPKLDDVVIINLTCINQYCDNSPADGIMDDGRFCNTTFSSWFQKNSYKTMSFTNGWAYADGEWITDVGSGWYWFQGNCSLGTYPRNLFINRTTGWAYGAINCMQNGAYYCSEP